MNGRLDVLALDERGRDWDVAPAQLSPRRRDVFARRAPRPVGRAVYLFEECVCAEERPLEQGEIIDCDYFPPYRSPLPHEGLLGGSPAAGVPARGPLGAAHLGRLSRRAPGACGSMGG